MQSTNDLIQNEIASELEQFDQEFNPQSGMTPGLEALPDGLYQMEILSVDLAKTQKTQDTILRWNLKVLEGKMPGTVVQKVNFFTGQQNVDILGSELCSLGIDADQWKPENKRKFSQELPKALPKLTGIRFVATKEAKTSNGKVYHNLRIKSLLPPMSGKLGSPSLPAAASDVDEDIPF